MSSTRSPAAAARGGDSGALGARPGRHGSTARLSPVVASHELGHNFGLYHSHALECGSVAMGGSCSSLDYGDVFDVMGGGNGPTHFNAVQKDLLGWLDYGVSPPVTDVVASGSYTIDPLETPGTNPKALRIQTAARRLAVRRVPSAGRIRQLHLHQRERDERSPRPLLRRRPQRRLSPRHDADNHLVVRSRSSRRDDLPGCGGPREHHAHGGERNECDRQRHRRRRLLRPAGADRDDHSGTAAGRRRGRP